MNILFFSAAALIAISCAACHSEQTRTKIENIETVQTTQPATNADAAADAETMKDSATTDGNSAN